MDIQYQKKKGFTLVSEDESFIFYDSLVRRVWIEDGKRPVVRVTGSHRYSCLFGAMSLEGKQLFNSMTNSTAIHFLIFLRLFTQSFQGVIFSWIKHLRHIIGQER